MFTIRARGAAAVAFAAAVGVGASLMFIRPWVHDAPALTSAPAVTVAVGADGGATVDSAGALVTAPVGALPAGALLSVAAEATALTGLDPAVVVGSTVWTVSASSRGTSVQPQKPVTVRLPLSDGLGDVVIMHQHAPDDPWLPLRTRVEGGFAIGEATSFSRFANVFASAGAASGFGGSQLNAYMYGLSESPSGCGATPAWAMVTTPVEGMSVTACASSGTDSESVVVHVRSNRGLPTLLVTTYPLRAKASGMGSLDSIPTAYQTTLVALGSADGKVGAGGSVFLPAAGQVDLVLTRPKSRQPNPAVVTAEITSDPKQMHDALTVMQVWDVVAAVTGIVPDGLEVPLKSLECMKDVSDSADLTELTGRTATCVKVAAAKDLEKYADPNSKTFKALARELGQSAADSARRNARRALSILKAWDLVGVVRDFGRRMGDEASPAKTTLLLTPLKQGPTPTRTHQAPTSSPQASLGFGGGAGARERALNGLPSYVIGDAGVFHCTRQLPFPASHDATSTSWLAWCDEQPARGYRSFTQVVFDDPSLEPTTARMLVTGTVESSFRNDLGYTVWILRASAIS